MADVPDENFGPFSQPFSGQNVVSFQTSAAPSGAGGGMPVYLDCSSNMTTNMGMMNTAPSVTVSTSNMTTNMGMMNTAPSVAVSTSSSSMVGDSAQNLKYGGNLAADWSQLEHQVLKECLDRYVNEHGIMKYIKIAASIPTKTVRDVAMRCQWLVNKQTTRRRRPAEHHSRKVKDRKDKMVGPSSWSTSQPVQMNTGVSSFVPHHAIQNSQYPSGASEIDRAAQLLLAENNQLLAQIEENLNTFQAQNNPDLFRRVNANLAALVQTMNQMPPTPIRLPQLGVAVNESLASYMFPNFSMEQNLGNSHLKEEPRGW